MRIVIAEDAVLLRAGLERLLTDAGHEVVAAVDDATGLLSAVTEHTPDLAVIDVRMPPTFTDEGVRAAVLIREQDPQVALLVLSQYVEERYASELIAGSPRGLGYVLKDRVADVDEFLRVVDTVGGGGTWLDPEVIQQILVRTRRRAVIDALTPREREVLEAMAQGRSNAAIAAELFLSAGSVEKHISSLFLKLGLSPVDGENRRVMAVLRYLESEDR
ncbi:response regulator transcription factor [Brachybacterium phenoliresistens]|uniref:LuxR family transcriptional regulator n=1 Tax=Brachybacterium phenoliresistens TaxID=396014 RepID=Z9JS90_9MICO|nr:response regulator transcription factor [Brachybacterium phenoliresistens]EWS80617.1 LuxR family transcriptional regulator [Brachybacterium phenoliresistens]